MAAIVAVTGALLGSPALPLLATQAAPTPARAPTGADGERFFQSREVGRMKVACADCHLITNPAGTPPDDRIRPGHSLFDAFGRGTWWNGRVTTDCGDAAAVCSKRYQGGEDLDPNDRTALVLFMKAQDAPFSNPLILQRRPPGQVEINQGDAARGRDLFRRACATCHASGGSSPGPDLVTSRMTPREIADLIRAGEGRMPLFQGDILLDPEVADIAAYSHSLQPGSN